MSKRPAPPSSTGHGRTKLGVLNKKPPQQSKFQLYGPQLQIDLNNVLKDKDPRVHDYQVNAVMKTRQKIEGDPTNDEPVLIVAPTGSGKSGMIVLLGYVLQSNRVLVLTPSKDITEQLAIAFGYDESKESFLELSLGAGEPPENKETLRDLLEPVTMIINSNQIKNRHGNLVIVNAQKFGGRSEATLSATYGNEKIIKNVKKFFGKFDTLLVDEAHHYPAKTWLDIVENFKESGDGERRKIVFLTATPYRKDAKGKDFLILPKGRIAHTVSREDVLKNTIRRAKFVEKKGYTTLADFQVLAKHLKSILGKNGSREPRIKHQAMVYVRRKLDADDLAKKLNEATKNPNFAKAIYSQPSKDKDVDSFNKGKFQVAIVCGSLGEGYDNCNVSCCVILKNMQSRIAFSQFVGRALRLKRMDDGEKDRTKAVVLSYTGFNQQVMWDQWDKLADSDPIDENEDE